MKLDDLPAVMTIEEAAQFLQVEVRVARSAAWTGKLPVAQLQPQILIDTRRLLQELGVQLQAVGTTPLADAAATP